MFIDFYEENYTIIKFIDYDSMMIINNQFENQEMFLTNTIKCDFSESFSPGKIISFLNKSKIYSMYYVIKYVNDDTKPIRNRYANWGFIKCNSQEDMEAMKKYLTISKLKE